MSDGMTVKCCVCHSPSRFWRDMPIDSKTFKPNAFRHVFRCDRCGHAAVHPLPSAEDVTSFYDLEQYYTQGQSHIPDIAPTLADRALTRVAWLFDKGKGLGETIQTLSIPVPSRVCEVGCGHAANLVEMRRRGHYVVGVDPDPKAIEKAAGEGITVHQGTGEALPAEIEPGSMDMVIMSHSLEHCIDPAMTVRNVRDLLVAKGFFVCEVPNARSTHFEWNGVCSEMFDAPRHLHFFTPSSLRKLLEEAGFMVRGVDYVGFTRHHSPGWRAIEVRIRDEVRKATHALPRKHSFLNSLLLWLATFSAPAERKYDSVRFVAQRVT